MFPCGYAETVTRNKYAVNNLTAMTEFVFMFARPVVPSPESYIRFYARPGKLASLFSTARDYPVRKQSGRAARRRRQRWNANEHMATEQRRPTDFSGVRRFAGGKKSQAVPVPPVSAVG